MKVFLVLAASVALLGTAVHSQTDPDIIKAEFRLHTKGNPNGYQLEVDEDGASVRNSMFNASHPTRFVIKGWMDAIDPPKIDSIRVAYLSRSDSFNVIMVYWTNALTHPTVTAAARDVPAVGAQVAEMVRYLRREASVSPASVTVIGHGLGAHAAGYAGRNLTGADRLGAIVALDPVHPVYGYDPLITTPVRPADALHVQAIHTGLELVNTAINGILDLNTPLGHSNFFPNHGVGVLQGECSTEDLEQPRTCAHRRALEFYAESLTTTTPFLARKCALGFAGILNWICLKALLSTNRRMGGDPLDTAASGTYYLGTNERSPYSKGTAGATAL